jgi:3-oxoacyl-(acyl-carrier-protein) synthase
VTSRVVTGFGVVSALGIGRASFNEALAKGLLPVTGAITAFDAAAFPGATVAEVPDFDASRFLGDKGLRSLDRQTKLLVVAARLCLHDAGLKKDGAFVALSPERVGLCASNAYGSLEAITELDRVAVLEDARYINPAKFPNTVANSASGYVSIWEDLRALNVAVSDGNCGALDTLACADVYLETGRADAIVVGGGEALSEGLYLAFQRLGSLTGGMLLGEGAALFVLETTESAKARGARIDAMLLGTGTSFVAPSHEGSLLHASPEAMTRAVTNALEEAGVAAKAVDLVVSGVSRTGAFADAELGGIARAVGAKVAVAAPKALLGETLGASGAMGMGAALAWLGGVPVKTLVHGDAPERVRTVVVTTLGFYGNATAAVLRREERAPS